jgi:hypothetical protein
VIAALDCYIEKTHVQGFNVIDEDSSVSTWGLRPKMAASAATSYGIRKSSALAA